MILVKIAAKQFRNLNNVDLEFSPFFNVFYGSNGSGKTSLLEAIYWLGMGRSFRSHLPQRVIQHEKDKLSLFGMVLNQDTPLSIGIERCRNGQSQIKSQGVAMQSIADLARMLPIQLINQDSFMLLLGGPKCRRQFIDWGVFHVEHNFYSLWKRFQRVLSQRNAALKQSTASHEIKLWDKEFFQLSQHIDNYRRHYLEKFTVICQATLRQLLNGYDLTFDYYPGWNTKGTLLEALNESYQRDLLLGFTQFGPHRADFKLKIKGMLAADILSRGEQKLLVASLRLAQGIEMFETTGKRCIYLLDDLVSELDADKRQRLMQALTNAQAQVFVTGNELKDLLPMLDISRTNKFHVEQGVVKFMI